MDAVVATIVDETIVGEVVVWVAIDMIPIVVGIDMRQGTRDG